MKMSRGQESVGPMSGEDPYLTLTETPEVRDLPREMVAWCPGKVGTRTQGPEANKARSTGKCRLRPWAHISRICAD